MNEQRLEALAARLKDMFNEYEILDEGFQLKVFITKDYYASIKDNFSTRNALDIVVGTRKDDWIIDLMYLPPMPIHNRE